MTASDSLKKESQSSQPMGICAKLITIREGRKEGKDIVAFTES